MNDSTQQYCTLGRAVIETELQALAPLRERMDDTFAAACERLFQTQGRIVVTGMGKSGHIGSKIAATLASTGSPAFFVHPGEASHGDLGMITANDSVIAISYSGESEEILRILPLIKRLGIPLIAMTGQRHSTLAQAADVWLNIHVDAEACPLGLAPTSSTTATLVMGDALAIALLDARGFTPEDFARSHPGGSLGKRLLLYVADLMRTGDAIPRCSVDANIHDMLLEMSQKGLGLTTVVDGEQLKGIFTDGDLRRALESLLKNPHIKAKDLMHTRFHTIASTRLAADALQHLHQHQITCLLVMDEHQQFCGVLHLHDILRAGLA